MKNLIEKRDAWVEKLREGDKQYMMITRTSDDCWYFVSNKHAEQILSLKMAIDRGNGLEPEYTYEVDVPETDKLWSTILIKGESKMLIEDNNGIYAFGIKDAAPPAKAFFMYILTNSMHTFVFGYEHACSVNIIHALSLEKEDAVYHCMKDMFSVPQPQSQAKVGECCE